MLNLLFGFQGRINRTQYWLGCTLIGFAGLALILSLTTAISGVDFDDRDAVARAIASMLLGLVPVVGLVAWCSLAVQVKRFHDRGRSGWLAAIPAALGALIGLLAATSPVLLITLGPVLLGAQMIVNLWFFIELGCLPSIEEPNRFDGAPRAPSPSPLTARSAAADAVFKTGTLGSAEAAMERAIAERARAPQAAPKANAPAPPGAPRFTPSPGGAAPSFGRRAASR